ncbi:hypothetical protein, partial [Haloferula sp.]|uniref:hypothetical protein n=1 Tax=Haloferula sp. TaxID=2497595 RepID=UPI003C74121C
PDYRPNALDSFTTNASLVAPEFQILDSVLANKLPNFFYSILPNKKLPADGRWDSDTQVKWEYDELKAKLVPPSGPLSEVHTQELITHLNLLLTHNTMSTENLAVIAAALDELKNEPQVTRDDLVVAAVYLFSVSPSSAIQK